MSSPVVSPISRCLLLLNRAAAIGAVLGAVASAQDATPSAPEAEPTVLSLFEVHAVQDQGYSASSAFSATSTHELVENLPNAISVITPEMINDLVLTDFFDAVDFAPGAENLYNAQGTVGAPVNTRGGNQISFRGLPAIRQLRDGFPWFLAADNFNTERIEFSRGPSGVAYGDIDPGGILNISTKRAHFRNDRAIRFQVDSFDSRRATVDLNQSLWDRRVALRVNAVDSRLNASKERKYREIEAIAAAVRIDPFKDHRTRIDVTFEEGNTSNHLSHLPLLDHTAAYVRGTGSSALDANPARAGVQTHGEGMRRIASGNTKVFMDLDGVIYNMTATTTNVFRNSFVVTGVAAINATDPQNPNLVPRLSVPFPLIPEDQDWGGPDNRHDSDYRAYMVELRHDLSENLSFAFTHSGQEDKTVRVQTVSNESGFPQVNSRSLLIDVNPLLPNPNGAGTLPNPNFEEYFVAYAPTNNPDEHKISNWRGLALWNLEMPSVGATQRVVAGVTHRREKVLTEYYYLALTPAEILRRGYTGARGFLANNKVVPVHYLKEGNSDEALALRLRDGATAFYRSDADKNRKLDQALTTYSVSALGSYFKERLRTTIGVSRDHWEQDASRYGVDPIYQEGFFLDESGALIPNGSGAEIPTFPVKRQWATNLSYGGVYAVQPWLRLTAGYFESSLFTDSDGTDLTGNPRLPRQGEGEDYSVRLSLFEGRLRTALTYFSGVSQNNQIELGSDAVAELNGILSPSGPARLQGGGDYRDQATAGYELEVQADPSRQLTIRATYSDAETEYTGFYPLVTPLLAEAREVASQLGLDPMAATQLTQAAIAETEGAIARAKFRTASLITRYTVDRGSLRGLAFGVAARHVRGKDVPAVEIAGTTVLPAKRNDDYTLVDPFIVYRRRTGKANWSLQLNVKNLFNNRSDQGPQYWLHRLIERRQYIFSAGLNF